MGLFSGLFGGGKSNPARAAMPYLNQIAPMAQQNLSPYVQQGQQAGQSAQGQYQQLVDNPADILNRWQSEYTPSAGWKFKEQQALRAAQKAAAQGGFSGTAGDQQMQANLASSLASEGMQEWVQNLLGLYGQGLQGQQHVADQGFGASTDLTNIQGSTLGAQGGLAYQGQAQKNQNQANMLKMLTQALFAAGGAGSVNPNSGGAAGGGIW